MEISYRHPDYEKMMQTYWQKCIDVYSGLNTPSLKQKYLPRWAGERSTPLGDPYQDRVTMTTFDNRFAPAINSHAGLLSGMTIDDDLPEMQAYMDNIDMRGSSVRAFGLKIDQLFLRDLACVVVVDQQARPDVDSEADNPELRPYLTFYPLSQVVDWDEELNWFKIARTCTVRTEEGTIDTVEQYIIYEIGQVRKVDHDGVEEVYPMTDYNGEPLQQIPFVWYSLFNSDPFAYCLDNNGTETVYIEPPLFNLLKLNLEHFRVRSEYNMSRHKSGFAVPVLKTGVPLNDLQLGTSSFVQVEPEGDFYFAEPSGASLGATQEDLTQIKEAMDIASQSFLSSNDNHVRTATEALLKSVQGRSILEAMRQIKESKWQEISEHWLRYTDPNYAERIEQGYNAISVDDSALRQAETVASLDRVKDWFEIGLVSDVEARKQIKHAGIMFPGFGDEDVSEEMGSDRTPAQQQPVDDLMSFVTEA